MHHYVCRCTKMEKKHASQIHNYENLQGIRVRIEGGISIFLYFSLVFFFAYFIKFECIHKFYIYIYVRGHQAEKKVRTSFPENLIIQLNEYKY